jgi:hypothetical protein
MHTRARSLLLLRPRDAACCWPEDLALKLRGVLRIEWHRQSYTRFSFTGMDFSAIFAEGKMLGFGHYRDWMID